MAGNKPGSREVIASMTTPVCAYLLCLCVSRLLAEIRPMLASAAEQRLYGRLRLSFFQHTLLLPLSFHLGRRSGAVVHTLQQGISGYQVILFSVVNSVVPVLIEGLTVTLVLLSLKLPALTAIFAATAIAYIAVTIRRSAGLGIAAQKVSQASADASSILADGLTNIEPVKSFGSERQVLDDFERSTAMLEQSWARLHIHRLHDGLAVMAIFSLSMSTSLFVAIDAVSNGTLSVGGFVLANIYMLQITRPLEMLVTSIRDMAQAQAFIQPMLEMFNEPLETPGSPRPSAPEASGVHPIGLENAAPIAPWGARAPRVRFKGIQLAYDGNDAVLTDLTIEIPAGRSTAIVGASGCGKSSLVRLLLRLCTPQGGTIFLDDIAIDTLPIATLRSMIAVVPQDTVLFNTTIAANIAIGKEGATPREIERAACLARLHSLVTALPAGYNTMIGERGLKLSGGERQRIAIARAILRDPLIYVFDEATSMLDGGTENAIMHNLRDISAGRTTITIAHRLSAIRHADQIVVMVGGRVAEQGDHTSLLACGGTYAAMWHAYQVDSPIGAAGAGRSAQSY